jgi:hypothetical protein
MKYVKLSKAVELTGLHLLRSLGLGRLKDKTIPIDPQDRSRRFLKTNQLLTRAT